MCDRTNLQVVGGVGAVCIAAALQTVAIALQTVVECF